MFNLNTWMILYCDTWPNVNMPHGIKNQVGIYINRDLQTYSTYQPTYLGK
jgi:hypothetical protein